MAEQIKNINFNVNTKEKFTIDGDKNKVIELDVTDINIVTRYKDAMNKIQDVQVQYNKLTEISKKMEKTPVENVDENILGEFSGTFEDLESKMRGIVDYVFDSEICDLILGKSSIFSPTKDGHFKYEQILDVLSNLYAKSIKSEMEKINKRNIQKHTQKYIGVIK